MSNPSAGIYKRIRGVFVEIFYPRIQRGSHTVATQKDHQDHGVLSERALCPPSAAGSDAPDPFHIPPQVISFFGMSPSDAKHLARPDAAPVTAEQTQPETQLALEDLLKDLAFQQEMIRASSVYDDLLFMAAQATLWSKTLKTIHTFSPTTAVEKARSVLEGKDTPPCLREAASYYVHSHFQSVKLAFISAGIERYQRDPDPTLGRKQGLRDLCGFLEKVVDRAFKAGETERLKEQMAGEVRKLVGAKSTPQSLRQPSVS